MESRFTEYYKEGHIAYKAFHMREAALLFAQARYGALLAGENAAAFQAGFWEALSWRIAGEYRHAFTLLFAILSDPPIDAPIFECWLAEIEAYELWLELGHRTRKQRMERLKKLTVFAASHPHVPAGDLPGLWARLASASGNWAEALCRWEEAWTIYDGKGYTACEKAFGALEVLMRMNRNEEAARWLPLINSTKGDRAECRQKFHMGLALLALFRNGDSAEGDTITILRALEQDLVGTQCIDNASARHLLARLWLLMRPDQDPEDHFHPARNLLRQKPERKREWDHLLTVADFRLAAVRFAAGMPPCDDYYYRQAQYFPISINPFDPDDFARRIQRTNLAIAHLQKKASLLDHLNECILYMEQVGARKSRLQAILQAL